MVIPTGAGKTGIMCILPFAVPMFYTGRVLIVAPNLTIREEIEKNLNETEKNFYRRTSFLSNSENLPQVASINTEDNLEDCDIIVSNIQQLTNDKNFIK